MNGIEFRAKSKITGKWVIGKNIFYLYPEGSDSLICVMIASDTLYTVDTDGYIKYKPDIVEMDTVGQYCGKRDENGVRIYELVEDNKLVEKVNFNLDFGTALDYLQKGFKLARKGWNGKNMFVVYQKGYPDGINCNKQTAEAWGIKEGELFRVEPYLQIQMANGSHSMWVGSLNDTLANDWGIINETKVN